MTAQPSVTISAPSFEHWRRACFTDLLPHQPEAVDFLAARRFAILGDEMGLGKTVEAIRAADLAGLFLVLVIAPKSMVRQWAREFAKWQLIKRPITIVERRQDVFKGPLEGVYIASWSMLRKVVRDLSRCAWHGIIADEAQYAKNPEADRTIALYGPNADSYGLVRTSHRVWLLSGGLTPNNPAELWPHLHALWPERIEHANIYQFTERFCVTRDGPWGRRIVGARNSEQLIALLRDIRLARSSRMLDLPPLYFGEIVIDPTQEAREAMARAYRDNPTEVERLALIMDACRRDFGAVAELEAANVQSSALRRLIGIIKAPLIARMMAEELKFYNHKLILFGWHLDVLDHFVQALHPFGVVRITGASSGADRDKAKHRFNYDPLTRVFIGQIIAGGVGVDLTGGNQVVFPELSWCPLDNLQAAKRPHRIGQIWPVYARSISLSGSLDEQLGAVLMRKMRMINAIQEEENRHVANSL